MAIMSKVQIATWLKTTANRMAKEDGAGCASLFIDNSNHDIALSVGWLSGYDPNDIGSEFRSKSQPEYALNAELVKYNPADCAELEWMEMPYNEETGEVWNTGCTLSADTNWTNLAAYYLDEYKAMVEEARKREEAEAEEAA